MSWIFGRQRVRMFFSCELWAPPLDTAVPRWHGACVCTWYMHCATIFAKDGTIKRHCCNFSTCLLTRRIGVQYEGSLAVQSQPQYQRLFYTVQRLFPASSRQNTQEESSILQMLLRYNMTAITPWLNNTTETKRTNLLSGPPLFFWLFLPGCERDAHMICLPHAKGPFKICLCMPTSCQRLRT